MISRSDLQEPADASWSKKSMRQFPTCNRRCIKSSSKAASQPRCLIVGWLPVTGK
uniref:Uncharacterized protein n=1 Tax=Anguilla anguilla TaxID=7936 RepID=A0A0E9XL00_ANGAN